MEIGTASGFTTRKILKLLREGDTLYCCDPFFDYYDKPDRNNESTFLTFKNSISEYVESERCHFGRQTSSEYLRFLLQSNLHESFDIILVDGFHNAKCVMEDFIHSNLLIKPGGLILFDDYSWVPRWERQAFKGVPEVKKAVDFVIKTWSDEYKVEKIFGSSKNIESVIMKKI